jgi:hypothetical protein
MDKTLRYKGILTVILLVIVFLGTVAFLQVRTLQRAHSSFNNYYAFRGCTQLIKRTSTYGVCKTNSGNVITIVLYRGKWYLKGDLPTGIFGHLL